MKKEFFGVGGLHHTAEYTFDLLQRDIGYMMMKMGIEYFQLLINHRKRLRVFLFAF